VAPTSRAIRSPTAPRQSSSRDVRILRAVAEALNGAGSVDQALETTLDQVTGVLGLDAAWIWLVDPHTGQFYSSVARRLPPFLREPLRMTGRPCWCLTGFRAGELTAGNIDVMECSRLREAVAHGDRARTHGLRYHASIPLYFADRPLGIMNIAAPAWRKLTRRELDLLATIASQVGVAIERARLAGDTVQVARMEERARLARELHDTLVQRLTAIGLHLDAALTALPGRSAARADLERALTLSRGGMDEARGSLRQLRSSAERSLAETLDTLARAFTAETGVRVHVRQRGGVDLSAADQNELQRIVSEALANVRKHAHATDVEISFTAGSRRLRLEIADNGRGYHGRSRSAGFGVQGMRERAHGLGGFLRITAAPGRGTRVTLTMPLGRDSS
jgi:two-component system NarL family sensor kinase